MQILSDNPGVLSDADACITVTSYPLISHDSSAAAPKNLLGLFQTVHQDMRKLASSICLWNDFWGGHASDGVGRFQELRVGERTFYYIALVSERDSTKFCQDHGVELLYAAQGKVFAVYASSPGRAARGGESYATRVRPTLLAVRVAPWCRCVRTCAGVCRSHTMPSRMFSCGTTQRLERSGPRN